jgi:nicotinate-nucleotide adenylyltransferase
MGGTFDPVHHGHLSRPVRSPPASAWTRCLRPDREPLAEVAPGGQPRRGPLPHDGDRTASNPRFSVSGSDVDRPAPPYTIDTLRDLRRAHPDAALSFITGADALAQILGWHAADELFELAHFIGVSRPGFEPVDLTGFPEGAVTLLEVPALAISSSDCRARVAAGDPIWYLVPDGVVQYVDKRSLYARAAS